jgi:hypothetical protein
MKRTWRYGHYAQGNPGDEGGFFNENKFSDAKFFIVRIYIS